MRFYQLKTLFYVHYLNSRNKSSITAFGFGMNVFISVVYAQQFGWYIPWPFYGVYKYEI